MPIAIPHELITLLEGLQSKGYKAYKCLQGTVWNYDPFTLTFHHVQGDPFAAPSRLGLEINLQALEIPPDCYSSSLRRLAVEDFLLRSLRQTIEASKFRSRGSGKSGQISIQFPSQKILRRSSLTISRNDLEVIHFAGLPAQGRTILGKEAATMFREVLPMMWETALRSQHFDLSRLYRHIEVLEDYQALQDQLRKNRWAAFVANGSHLPRASGVSDLPLKGKAVEFESPGDFTETVMLPHRGKVAGMAIPQGITLIVGGGFHGKSTLLCALQSAVYPHIPGDGRETCATDHTAVKIRAEDGRMVHELDISGFMTDLPLVPDTCKFSTASASGSTSQAANILEAMESGAKVLLIDEDTSASNFMIRDARMQALIHADKEPITPLVDRIEELYEAFELSSILVMGGSGDYFESAQYVIAMENFRPRLVTDQAKAIIKTQPGSRNRETRVPFPPVKGRRFDTRLLDFSRGKKPCVIEAQGLDYLVLGTSKVDIRHLEQVVETGQISACGWLLRELKDYLDSKSGSSLEGFLNFFENVDEGFFTSITPYNNGLLTVPRIHEALAMLNRIREK